MTGKPKSKKPAQLPNTTPIVIDGETINEQTLIEFLDWSFVTDSKDYKMFKHLRATGYFEKNPITPQMLQNAMEACAAKGVGK